MTRVRVVPGAWQAAVIFGVLGVLWGVLAWVSGSRHQPVWFAVETTALTVASLLVHETAHGLTGRALGERWTGLEINRAGFTTHLEHDTPRTPRHQLWISLNGPLAGIAFCLLCAALPLTQHAYWINPLLLAAASGTVLNLTNLLPWPTSSDGAKIRASVTAQRHGRPGNITHPEIP